MPAALLEVWESARDRAPAERALCLLAAGQPSVPWETLAAMKIGERDARLLTLRQSVWGPSMLALATCPACREPLEFTVDVRQILGAGVEPQFDEMRLSIDECSLFVRLPTALDALEAASETSLEAARDRLIESCVISAEREGVQCEARDLPDETIAAIAQQISAADPLADIRLDVMCPGCDHRWAAAFDIGEFFWNELEVWAKRMLREVHTLAKAYGWAERDILSMGPRRRQFYLESVGA